MNSFGFWVQVFRIHSFSSGTLPGTLLNYIYVPLKRCFKKILKKKKPKQNYPPKTVKDKYGLNQQDLDVSKLRVRAVRNAEFTVLVMKLTGACRSTRPVTVFFLNPTRKPVLCSQRGELPISQMNALNQELQSRSQKRSLSGSNFDLQFVIAALNISWDCRAQSSTSSACQAPRVLSGFWKHANTYFSIGTVSALNTSMVYSDFKSSCGRMPLLKPGDPQFCVG